LIYYIKKTLTGTKKNKYYCGCVVEIIYGLRQNVVSRKVIRDMNNYSKNINQFDMRTYSRFIDDYSYKSEKMAKVAMSKMIKANRIYPDINWDCKFEIISIEI
jgi:ribosomal protein S10